MNLFLFNANDICRTRLCAAWRCEYDAEHGSPLCSRCEERQRRGVEIRIHQNPPQTAPLLWCSACKTEKPDEAFPLHTDKPHGFRSPRRRNRFWCCTDCVSKGKHR